MFLAEIDKKTTKVNVNQKNLVDVRQKILLIDIGQKIISTNIKKNSLNQGESN